ncbi:MAG: hypothetical protein WDZ88_02630 [Candidatus Paceibacterota bacterium]
MKESSSVLNSIIALLITVSAFGAFVFLYLDKQTVYEEQLVIAKGQINDSVVTDLIRLVDRVKDIEIPTAVFEARVFESLVDHSALVPLEQTGRPDPFAPVPGLNIERQ